MKYRPEGLIRGINIFLDDLTRYAVQSNAKEFRHTNSMLFRYDAYTWMVYISLYIG